MVFVAKRSVLTATQVQKSLWRSIESALTTILTLTPRILSQNMRSGYMFMRGTVSQEVSVLSAATILSSVTKTLLSSTQLNCASAKQRHQRAIDQGKLAKIIREECNVIIQLVERLKGKPNPQVKPNCVLPTRNVFAFSTSNPYINKVIHPALIAHAHQLVDALLVFCSPLAVENSDLSRCHDPSERMYHTGK